MKKELDEKEIYFEKFVSENITTIPIDWKCCNLMNIPTDLFDNVPSYDIAKMTKELAKLPYKT